MDESHQCKPHERHVPLDAPAQEISSGESCTSQCGSGYTPSVATLSCSLGKLSPETFSCKPNACSLPKVPNRMGNGCKGINGNSIESGEFCYPECQKGYTPSEDFIKCNAQKLTPGTFSCDPNPCPLPSVKKAQGNGCKGASGSMLDSGGRCKARLKVQMI